MLLTFRSPSALRLVALALASGAAAAVLHPSLANAQAQWQVASGNWNNGANWDVLAVPSNAGGFPGAAIANDGAATINSAVPTLTEVFVGNGPNRGTLTIETGGSLTLNSGGAAETGYLAVGRTAGLLGAPTGTSSVVMNGGTLVADQIEIGQAFGAQASTATMTVGGTSSVTIRNFMRVGHGDASAGANGTLTLKDNATFTHNGTGTLTGINEFIAFGFNGLNGGTTGTLNLQNNAVFNSKRAVRFGWVEEGKGFLNVSGNAQLNIDAGEMAAAPFMLGDFNNGSNATPNNRPIGIGTQSGGTVNVGTDAGRARWVAIGGSGRGEYTLSGGKLNVYSRDGLNIGDTDQNGWAGEGVFTMTGGTLNATELWLGKIGRATGTFTQSGGSVNVGVSTPDGNFVDRIDTLPPLLPDNVTPNPDHQVALGIFDGRLTLGGSGATSTGAGTYTLSNGSLHTLGAYVGNDGTGTFTMSGGAFTAEQGVVVAQGATGTGTLHLNGGTLTTSALTGGAGNATVNFNGATVKANGANTAFLTGLDTANIAAGGAIVDSNSFNIGSDQALAGGGGLTKRGAGTLTLTGATSYTGDTRVEGGTLSLASNTLANAADVYVSTGALLNLAFATPTTTDIIDSLFLGGSAAQAGVWGPLLSGAQFESSFITGTGRLQVTTAPAFPPGDFNKDTKVDSLDLAKWRLDFGQNANSDADGDGDSDGNDFVIWQRNLGTGVPALAAANAVPEPAALGLAAMAAAGLLATRRKRNPA